MPSVPSSMAARIRCAAGQNRRWNSTPSVTPAASQAAIIRAAEASSIAIGFSHSTCAPRAAAAVTTASWVGCGVHTLTTSTPRSSSASTSATGGRDAVPGGEPGGPLRVDVAAGHDVDAGGGAEGRERGCRRCCRSRRSRPAGGRHDRAFPSSAVRRPVGLRRGQRGDRGGHDEAGAHPRHRRPVRRLARAEQPAPARREPGGQQADHQADRHPAVPDAGRELLGEPGRRRPRWARRSRCR